MKSKNLKIIQEQGINVPEFIVIKSIEELQRQIDNIRDCNIYAVRSSFYAEDSSSRSYAGQFKTILNVNKSRLESAVREVFESYNEKSDSNEVIIQKMINSEYSGVVFTINPLGIMNELVINIGYGLGDDVVSDKSDTTSYYYNYSDKIYFADTVNNSPILSDELIKQLIETAIKIKNILSTEVDIEFAIENNEIYILQVRDITTINSNFTKIILDNSNISESYPGISLPITQSFAKEIYSKIFESTLKHLTEDDSIVETFKKYTNNMVDSVNGRIYYRISNWYNILRLLPFSNKIINIWQNMLGVENKEICDDDIKISSTIKLRILKNFIKYMKNTPSEMKKLNSWFENNINTYWENVNNTSDYYELLEYFDKLIMEISDKWYITLVNDMYCFLYTALAKKLYKNGKADIAYISNLESMKPLKELHKLKNSKSYEKDKEQYINMYGDRCIGELKLETKTFRTNPTTLDDYIKTFDFEEEYTLAYEKHEKFAVKRAKIGIQNREISRLNRTRIFGLARQIIIKLADILVSEDKISSYDDVFYLYIDELKDKSKDYKSLVELRKQVYNRYEKIPYFSRLIFNGEIVNKHPNNICNTMEYNSKILVGTPTSLSDNEVVTGEVIIINNSNINVSTKGKIIVTETTDPGWVFIIKDCIGIIAEKGSILSHTAIIARELNKPAVVNVKNATKLLKDNDKVSINTRTGEIIKYE